MAGANTGATVIADAGVGIEKTAQSFDIFIIDVFDIVVAEVTKFHPVRVLRI